MSNGHGKHNYEATGLEKIYNSVLPYQQWAYRAARVWQDKDVDFWSAEGFKDMSVVPFLGYFDDDRHDVSSKEMVERLPDFLDLDPNDGTTQFWTSVITDPAMYLTRGVTAPFSAALKMNKAVRVPALSKVLMRNNIKAASLATKTAPTISNKQMLSHIDEAIALQTRVGAKKGVSRFGVGKTARKSRGLSHLHKARKLVQENIDKGIKNVPKFTEVEKRMELIMGIGLGVPFGSKKANLWSKTLKTDKEFWLTYAAAKATNPIVKGAGHVYAPLAAKFPQVGKALKAVARPPIAFKAAIETGGLPLQAGKGDLTMSQVDTILKHNSEVANTIFGHLNYGKRPLKISQIRNAFDSFVKNRRGADKSKRGFLKAVTGSSGPKGGEAMRERYEEVLRSFLDLGPKEVLPELSQKELRSLLTTETPLFRQRWKSANATLKGGLRNLEDTLAGKARKAASEDWFSKKTFDWTRATLGQMKTKFTVGGSSKVLVAANEAKVRNDNLFQNHLVEVGQQYVKLLARDAAKLGVDGRLLDRMMGRIAQGTIRKEEVGFIIGEMNKGGVSGEKLQSLGVSLLDVVNRIEDTVASHKLIGSAGSDNQLWTNIIEELSKRFAATGNRKSVAEAAGEFKGNKVYPGISEAESLAKQGATKQSIYRLPDNIEGFGGRFIAELSNDEIYGVLQTVSKGFKPDPLDNVILGKFYRAKGTHQVIRIQKMRESLGLNAISMFKLLEKVKKGSTPRRISYYDDMYGVGPGKGKVKAGRNLTEAEQLELVALGRGAIAPDQSALVDISKLTDNQKELFSVLNESLMARRAGFDRGPFKPEKVEKADVLNARVVDEVLDPELNEFGAALGKLALLGGELKRVAQQALKGKKVTVGPEFIRQMEEALEFSGQTFDDVVRSTLGKHGATETLDYMKKIQRDTLIKAVENGNATVGMPFAYLGRVFSRDSTRQITDILSGAPVTAYLRGIMPTQSGQFKRGYADITVEELNDIIHALDNNPPPMESAATEPLRRLRKIYTEEAGKTGINIDANKKFAEGAFFPTIHRYAQELANETDIHYSHQALDALNDTNQGVAGKIIGHVRDGKQHIFATRKSLDIKFGDDAGAVIEKSKTPISSQSTVLLIQDTKGNIQGVPMADAIDPTRKALLLDEGDDINSVFALRAARGNIRPGEHLATRINSKEELFDLANKNIVISEAPIVNGLLESLNGIHRNTNSNWMAYDSITYMMKKVQTVLRPAFSGLNLASVPNQLMAVGISFKNSTGGFADAMRMFTLDPKSWGKYERLNLHENEKLMGFIPRTGKAMNLDFLRDLNAVGLEKMLERGPDEFFKKYGDDLDLADWDFHMGDGTKLGATEMFEDWARGQMFTTFGREGLGVGRSVSYEMLRIWNSVMGDGLAHSGLVARTTKRVKDAKGLAGAALLPVKAVVHVGDKYVDAATKLAEATEVTARLTAYFGAIRQGFPSKEAVEIAKTAMVDYGKLAPFEKNVMKRIIPFYTFQRQFLPAAGAYYAAAPNRIAFHAKVANDMGLREQRGRLMFDFPEMFGKELSIDITRMMPLLEALKFVETATEIMDLVPRAVGMESKQSRREQMSQRTPMPFTAGSLPGAAMEALMAEDDERNEFKKLVDAFWMSRFIYDGSEDPLKEQTALMKGMSILLPVSERDRKAQRATINRKFEQLKNNINNRILRAKQSGDWDLRDRLENELEQLQELKIEKLEEQDD